MAAIAVGVGGRDGFFIQLGEQNVGDGAMDGLGCMLEQVGEADVKPAFAETDGGIEAGEAVKADIERRNGCAGPEVPVLLFKYGDKRGRHCFSRLARWLAASNTAHPTRPERIKSLNELWHILFPSFRNAWNNSLSKYL